MNPLLFTKKTIHRQLLEDELKRQAGKFSGKILDIGSKDARYSNWFVGEVISIDITPNPKKGVIKGDINNLNFEPSSFDTVIATEVFEYLANTTTALNEIFKVLKPGGTLLLSVPLIYRVHGDLVRYTEEAWGKFLVNFSQVDFFYIGNFYTIILDVLRDKITKFPNRVLRYLIYLPFIFLIFLSPFLLKLSKDRNFVSGYLISARK